MVCEFGVHQGPVAVLAVRVTDRQRHFRLRYRSLTLCYNDTQLYILLKDGSSLSLSLSLSLCCLTASSQFIGGSH